LSVVADFCDRLLDFEAFDLWLEIDGLFLEYTDDAASGAWVERTSNSSLPSSLMTGVGTLVENLPEEELGESFIF